MSDGYTGISAATRVITPTLLSVEDSGANPLAFNPGSVLRVFKTGGQYVLDLVEGLVILRNASPLANPTFVSVQFSLPELLLPFNSVFFGAICQDADAAVAPYVCRAIVYANDAPAGLYGVDFIRDFGFVYSAGNQFRFSGQIILVPSI